MLQLGDEPNDAFFFCEDEQKKREKKGVEKNLRVFPISEGFGTCFFLLFLLEELFVNGHPPDVNGGQNGPCDQDTNDDADSAQGKRPKKTDESRRGVPTLSGGGFRRFALWVFSDF